MINLNKFFFSILFLFFFASNVFSCDIYFSVLNNKKAEYKAGEELVLKVKIHNTHRVCPEDINKVKFEENGIKILSATRWSESSSGVFERKLKLKIENSKSNQATMRVIRTCDKEGGRKTFSVKVAKS